MKLSLFPFLCALLSAVEEDPAASLTQPWDESKPFGLAFLISLERDLETATLWERWIQDAFTYIHEAGIEDSKVPMNESQILRFFINYNPEFEREVVQDFLPPSLKNTLIEPPTECLVSNPNPCDHRVYLVAFETMPTAEYFILASSSSAPLKTFSFMYEEAKKDRRIRASVLDQNFSDNTPRTVRWRAEPREVVELRLWDMYWLNSDRLVASRRICGPDECGVWRPILQYYGNKILTLFKKAPLLDRYAYYMFDCRGDQENCNRAASGKRTGSPYRWSTIDPTFLGELISNPDRWLIRQISDTTTILETTELAVDRIDKELALRHGYNQVFVPPRKEVFPDVKQSDILEQRQKYRDAKLFGIRNRFIGH
eukprot:Blabericola_migrator_1__3659@NODE_2097_length_3280_cov_145_455960_g1328_i0_p2_GENE_NODE_2097_length_3280_cov_145_455960_g1328_i0NODE_2097_length_3280_cov_145_455960_g1328_i0_p2_ORF_typecomplete_len370_score50_43Branch/PF02485_21/3_9e06_NODE_2097_length_3280_cov_145_455960_g1328_i08972006